MHIVNACKQELKQIDFGSLDAGDVFVCNGSTRVKLAAKIFHVQARYFRSGEPNEIEILDYDSVCLDTGELCKHEFNTPVSFQPVATVYLKG